MDASIIFTILITSIPLSLLTAALTAFGLRRANRSEEASQPTAEDTRFTKKQGIILGMAFLLLSVGLCLFRIGFYQNSVFDTIIIDVLLCFLTIAACIDGKRRIIPLWLTRSCGIAAMLYLVILFCRGSTIGNVLAYAGLGVLFGGGIFLLCSLISRGGMGMGDVRLFGVLGLFLGWQRLLALMFYTVLSISAYGIVRLIQKRITSNTTLPIGPFALIGMAMFLLLGN